METITIKDDIATITETIVRTIDLKSLKAELEFLKAEKAPSDIGVLELAKQGEIHPYYEPDRDYRIRTLEEDIAKWQ